MNTALSAEAFLENMYVAIFDPLMALLIALGVVYFLWGLATFLMNAGEAAQREEGKRRIIWGIIGLFIMISVYGIINIVVGTFGIENEYLPGADADFGSIAE